VTSSSLSLALFSIHRDQIVKAKHPHDKRVGRSTGDAYSTALVKGLVIAPSCSSPSLTTGRFGLNHLSSRIMPVLIACSPEKSKPLGKRGGVHHHVRGQTFMPCSPQYRQRQI
jgi:hypothetical protein